MTTKVWMREAAATAALALLLAACGGGDDTAAEGGGAAGGDSAAAGAPADSAAAGGPQAAAPGGQTQADGGPTVDLPPNEMGRIMVLEYHRIGSPEGEFVRTLANYRKDLESLYQKGYRPVTMRQVLEGKIDIPRGTTPVVFTFDDATRGQFYYLPNGQIDPNTMVGSWAAFKERNPGWSGGATWCVLPAAGAPSNFFSEKPDKEIPREQREANIRKKVSWLVENGHELCNHTLYHARLDRGTDRQVQDWLGIGEDSIKAYLPADYDIVTMALPLGMWPKNRSLAWAGTYRDNKRYEYKVVLEVSGGPNVPPWDKRWDPHSVDRFIVAPGALERQLKLWDEDPSNRYISDGDPSTMSYPQRMAAQVEQSRLMGKRAQVVPDAPAQNAAAGAQPGAAPAPPAAGGGGR
jgi:peptidoglycan/xylan/chitin deacetylase (PgdA/CDA1 family)